VARHGAKPKEEMQRRKTGQPTTKALRNPFYDSQLISRTTLSGKMHRSACTRNKYKCTISVVFLPFLTFFMFSALKKES